MSLHDPSHDVISRFAAHHPVPRVRPTRSVVALLIASLIAALVLAAPSIATTDKEATKTSKAGDGWPHWGGPSHDFRASTGELADRWPESGPAVLWQRELGEGYSTITVDGDRLYTMYRDADDIAEVVVALDAATGKTVWERRIEAAPEDGHVDQFGRGPRATPLLVDGRIFTIGVSGVLTALDQETGEVLWSHDLWDEYDATFLNHGYSSSPIAYGDDIITLVGGEGSALVAFDQKTGEVEWKNLDFGNSYSTPRLHTIDGELQLVTFLAEQLVGVDPDDGSLLWEVPHTNQWKQNINMPAVIDGEILFLSSPQAGAKGLKLGHDETGKTTVDELWSTRKIQFYHGTTVRDGDWIYGSTGTGSPAFMAAVNAKTGELGWRKRGYAKANLVWADGKLFILDENGVLTMAKASPEDLEVLSQAEVLQRPAWSAPTIVGQTMYVRDNHHLKALDLSGKRQGLKTSDKTATDRKTAEETSSESNEAETTADAASDAPAIPPASETRDAKALEILTKADAATKAVEAVTYRATSEPSGIALQWMKPAKGTYTFTGWAGGLPAKYVADLEATSPDGKPGRVTGGGNGEQYFVIDHAQKKAWVDVDPNVAGSYGSALQGLAMPEFVHPTPFADELQADALKLLGDTEIGGVDCWLVEVTYSAGRGTSLWAIAKEDHLPRQRTRQFQDGQGNEGGVTITLTELDASPEIGPKTFAFQLPEGYERIDDFAP